MWHLYYDKDRIESNNSFESICKSFMKKIDKGVENNIYFSISEDNLYITYRDSRKLCYNEIFPICIELGWYTMPSRKRKIHK